MDGTEWNRWLQDVTFASLAAPAINARITRQYGQIMQFNVRMHASGYPGPEIRTGHYRNSISLDFETAGDVASAEVYTEQPQGFRLEFGFYGVDSIGREQFSQPYPHWMPSFDMTVPVYREALSEAMHSALARGKG